MPRLTMGALIHTVQGCDGYSMDLFECAEHYGVAPDHLRKFVADGPPWLIIQTCEDTGEEVIACDGE